MNLSPLAPGGALAHSMLGYEDRPGQRKMAEAVAETLDLGGLAFIEAGTGTGKTLAYLVPAIESGLRVLVSTGTKALQDQIAEADLPTATAVVGAPVSWTTLKGTSNYLCRRRYHGWTELATDGDDAGRVHDWLLETTTGQRNEVDVPTDLWRKVSTTSDGRLGARCPYFDRCFVTRARRRAGESQIIVVNHHLLCADRAIRELGGEGILPDVDATIIDEAHLFSAALTEHFSLSISGAGVARLLGDLSTWAQWQGQEAAAIVGVVANASDAWRAFHVAMNGVLANNGQRVTLDPGCFRDHVVEIAWFAFDDRLAEIGDILRSAAAQRDEAGEESSLAARVGRYRDTLAAVAEDSTDHYVRYAELGKQSLTLCAAPIDVGPQFHQHFAEAGTPVVLTSATLTCASEFRFTRQQLGCADTDARELRISSPFDYAEQALLYIAGDLPDPREPEFATACLQRMTELIAITGGRTLVLCTSHRALGCAAAALPEVLEQQVLIQGQREPASLLREFRRDETSVLVATGTFWQGVDVPGPALSQVILDKLPFSPPDEPLTAARARLEEERGRDPFFDFALPSAALGFAQGVGRLLRRKSDRGLISVLDRRLIGKRYGRVFLDSLPANLPRTASVERARRWWRDG